MNTGAVKKLKHLTGGKLDDTPNWRVNNKF